MNTAGSQAGAGEWRASWYVVMASTAGMSLGAIGTYSLGVMIPAIEQDLGWTRAQISTGPAILSLVSICVASLLGMAVDRVGARLVGSLSAALLCAGLAMLSLTTASPWSWWAIWVIIALASASTPTVWTAPINRLFDKQRGLALAVVLSGTGIGATVVPPLAGYVVTHYDWRTGYLVLAGLWAAVALPIILLGLRSGPSSATGDAGVASAGRQAPANAELPGLTVKQGFCSADFYKIAVPTGVGTLCGVGLIVNMVPMLNAGGMSIQTAASIAGIIGITTIIGRITGGYLLDKFDARVIAFGSTLGPLIFAACMLAFPGSVVAGAIGVALYGLTSGPKIAAVVYLAGKYFGQRNFGTLFGTIQAALAMGAGLGPLLANYVYDVTRSYSPFLWAVIPIFLVCAVTFLTLGKQPDFESGAKTAQ